MLETLLNGRYKIIRVLGSGGFGKTYLAENTQHPDQPVCVVKQFKPAVQDVAFLEIARRLFFSEAASLKKLGSHDQIPTLLDDFEENQEFYLVQEYVEGQLLSQELIDSERLSEAQVIMLLRDVLQVLEFVHRNQVIHRDIKPGNLIRRQRDGKFVLIDFGAVKEIQTQLNSELIKTSYTVGIGTQGYGPSEQMAGQPRYSSDLYALGMTAIQALTGLQPAQLPTHPDTAELVWHDRAEVSPKLMMILDKMVRFHFNQRYQSASEVLRSLDLPAEAVIEPTQFPKTWLPSFRGVGEALVSTEITRKRGGLALASLTVGVASLAVTGCLLGMRQIGWLQTLEVAAFDRMVQISPDLGPDSRLLVVGITDQDIQELNRFPVSDHSVAQLLKKLKFYQPRVIGVDLLRDIPQEPGRTELLAELKAPNVIAIMNLGPPITAPPKEVSAERTGFNDFPLDPSGDVVRRGLLLVDTDAGLYESFSLRLAKAYLAAQGILFDTKNSQLGKAEFNPLATDAGGYQAIDATGYQILLKYRSRNAARQVSLSQVLKGQIHPEWVKDKVVLIGTTAKTGRDFFSTPYSVTDENTSRMAGVFVHANMVSQFLSAAVDGQPLPWYWPEWIEVIWIGGWAIAGGNLAWFIRRPLILVLSGGFLLVILTATCFWIFTQQGWVPVVAPALAATATGAMVLVYCTYRMQQL